jgi:glycosyltransferase involved in cell wall biosynthesis
MDLISYCKTILRFIRNSDNLKLVIISHTPHQYLSDGTLVGWGPTVAELNYLSQYWNELIHVACIEPNTKNPSLQPYTSNRIRFAPIPSFGGITWLQKLSVFYQAFQIIWTIVKSLKGATHVQIRIPMGIGIYVLPLFLIVPRKFILWVKYANNWGHVSNSLGYRFQRWFLDKNFLKCAVTINGFWPSQKQHLKSFENPCINNQQFEFGKAIDKSFDNKLRVIFAGRIEAAKGIDLFMKVLETLPQDHFKEWIFIGEGPMKEPLQKLINELNINATFPGFVSQSEVHSYLAKAHILILPSKSEGFPKIVAESWNYQVIPLVSPVGSLPHYLEHGKNGFMMANVSQDSLNLAFEQLLKMTPKELTEIAKNGQELAHKFTFEYYYRHLQKEVFS